MFVPILNRRRKIKSKYLTQKILKRYIHYNPETGIFIWIRPTASWMKPGTMVGNIYKDDPEKGIYLCIKLLYTKYKAHRLAWLYMTGKWPNNEVDHIDTDGTNNKWNNLRQATPNQNSCNKKVYKNSKTGIKGVYPKGDKFIACITINKKRVFEKEFKTIKEAKIARDAVLKQHHKEFARAV